MRQPPDAHVSPPSPGAYAPAEAEHARFATALAERYELARVLGRGGMATVYLARDVRHDRPVAIKVLDPELGAVLGAERFLSEIRVTANLQHPNLLALFDSGEAAGLLFYVMPYVEGETLRARLERERQLPVDEAVRLAVAISSAVDYAHRHGVIHRDLKPENILLHDGQPVVADFGIALAVSKAGGQRVTQTGLSLGTPQYMSPEQATGDRVIDGRADVYALGAVTYEMLTGEPPHHALTAQATLAKLMTEEPRPPSALRRTVPAHVDAAVLRALEKLPADRFATARDFAQALAAGDPHASGARRPTVAGARSRGWQVATAAAVVAAAASAALALRAARAPRAAPVHARFVLLLPDSMKMVRSAGPTLGAISHDGTTIAYVGRLERNVVNLRRLDEVTPRTVPGTEGARSVRFAPDDRALAFVRNGVLYRVSLGGSSPTQLADSLAGGHVAWLDDGSLVFERAGSEGKAALWLLPPDGTRPVQLTHPSADERSHEEPAALPGGRAVLLSVPGRRDGADRELAVATVPDGRITRLGIAGRAPQYADGMVAYVRAGGALGALPFDPVARRATGEATEAIPGSVAWILAPNGTLVQYENAGTFRLARVDRTGKERRLLDRDALYSSPALSPDGRRVALSIGMPPAGTEIWVAELESRTVTRLSAELGGVTPTWSADGRRVLWSRRGDRAAVLAQPWDASAPPEVLVPGGQGNDLLPGGTAMLTTFWPPSGRPEHRIVPLPYDSAHRSSPIVLRRAPGFAMARLSPDGQWIAFVDEQNGVQEVFVHSRATGGRYQVSAGGGFEPLWRRDGRELFYRTRTGLMAARLALGAEARVVGRDSLFAAGWPPGVVWPNYDVTADGNAFLIPLPNVVADWPTVTLGWTDELRERLREGGGAGAR